MPVSTAADGRPTKAELRARLQAARVARPAAEIAAARAALRAAVLSVAAGSGWRSVACYEPFRTEPGSVELLDELTARGVAVLLPRRLADNDLDWVRWGTAEPLGVGAIAAVDAALVPALAVAADGTRLGRGGGSYDRALGRIGGDVPVAALLFDGEVVDELPSDPWDRPVTAVVTPSGWRRLR